MSLYLQSNKKFCRLNQAKISLFNSESISRLLFCGDIFLNTHNKHNPFTQILQEFEKSLVCINLETSLRKGREKKKNVSLSVTEKALDYLPESLAFVSIVNNHSADAAEPGRLAELLRKRGKQVIGPSNPSVLRACVNGQMLDFMSAYLALPRGAYYGGTVGKRLEELLRSSDADRRIVNLHWGYEHTEVPAPFQRDLAHRLIDVGANIIVGHHPHVAQGWEIYHGAPIFYSLGNFNFWQFDIETTEKNRWGYMVAYDIINAKAEPIPYRINENYQPIPSTTDEYNILMARLSELSEKVRLSINRGRWFESCYKNWFNREFQTWKRHSIDAKSPQVILKFLVWLILPLQLIYYVYTIKKYLRRLF